MTMWTVRKVIYTPVNNDLTLYKWDVAFVLVDTDADNPPTTAEVTGVDMESGSAVEDALQDLTALGFTPSDWE